MFSQAASHHPWFLIDTLSITLPALIFLAPVIVPSSFLNYAGLRFARFASLSALAAFGFVVFGVTLRIIIGSPLVAPAICDPLGIDLYFDSLSATMLLLISFLATVIMRYAVSYLAGDPQQGRFSKWLSVTLGCVFTLVISGNLLMFTLAWVATSLSLHKLLAFYPDRPRAILAARKKFIISRLGDACLIGAIILSWHCFGSWQFKQMFIAAEAIRTHGGGSICLTGLDSLLVAGALLKSAQFPFHSWLPDTMETPTPVSALMHAGIINAGGFLVVRMGPIIAITPSALNALAFVGAFTALFASVVMLTQTSVKRALAYSTIAQMGFMMLQCGLGAFGIAVLHIVAHSLYKAHSFLSSGSIVALGKSSWVPSDRPASQPLVLLITLTVAIALSLTIGTLFNVTIAGQPGVLLLGAIFTMALAYFLWNLWSSSHRSALWTWGLLIAAAASATYFALHAFFDWMLASSLPHYSPARSPVEYAVMIMVALLFMSVLIFQSQIPAWSASRLGKAFYAHALNGFYLGAIANRFTSTLTRIIPS